MTNILELYTATGPMHFAEFDISHKDYVRFKTMDGEEVYTKKFDSSGFDMTVEGGLTVTEGQYQKLTDLEIIKETVRFWNVGTGTWLFGGPKRKLDLDKSNWSMTPGLNIWPEKKWVAKFDNLSVSKFAVADAAKGK